MSCRGTRSAGRLAVGCDANSCAPPSNFSYIATAVSRLPDAEQQALLRQAGVAGVAEQPGIDRTHILC